MRFPSSLDSIQLNNRDHALRVVKVVLLLTFIGILIALLAYSGQGDCWIIEGATYQSDQEVDNFFGGTMHPHVSFGNGRFTWAATDIVIAGEYECGSGRIISHAYFEGIRTTAELDRATGLLFWSGEPYIRIPR